MKTEDDPLGKLMHDFKCENPDDMHYALLREQSKYYKESQKGVTEMCEIMEEMLEENTREVTEEVTQKVKVTSIHNIMETLKITADAAMDALKIAQEEREIYRSLLAKVQ